MHAIQFDSHGPFENLYLADIDVPKITSTQCLVKVNAVSLNGFDPMVMRGIPGLKTPLPMIPGADIAGEIVEVGANVDSRQFAIKQRVSVDPSSDKGMMGETRRGGLCDFIAVEADQLVPVPDTVDDHAAACLPTAYATAHRMLFTRGQIHKGEKVLILGASGGVGTCCIQLAKMAGCEVIAVTSSRDKQQRLRDIGADHVVDTTETDYVDFVIDTYGKPRTRGVSGGVDVCVNYSGGQHWAKSLRTVRRGGRILTCGATGGYDPQTDIRYIWSFEQTILGSNGWSRQDHKQTLNLMATGELIPVIDRVVPMGQVGSAMRDLQERRVIGKVVLEID